MRETVAKRVQATSLRVVARQVGMSPAVLERFMRGGTPYVTGRRKLYRWWAREGGSGAPGTDGGVVAAALPALVADLPEERRPGALRALVRTLRAIYRAQGGCPGWLDDAAERWGE